MWRAVRPPAILAETHALFLINILAHSTLNKDYDLQIEVGVMRGGEGERGRGGKVVRWREIKRIRGVPVTQSSDYQRSPTKSIPRVYICSLCLIFINIKFYNIVFFNSSVFLLFCSFYRRLV